MEFLTNTVILGGLQCNKKLKSAKNPQLKLENRIKKFKVKNQDYGQPSLPLPQPLPM